MSAKNKVSPDAAAREQREDIPLASERSGSGQTGATTGISNRESADEEQQQRDRLPQTPGEPRWDDDTGGGGNQRSGGARQNEQSSSKHGSRSEAQKAAESKYVDRPHPASEKTDGAFGRESGD